MAVTEAAGVPDAGVTPGRLIARLERLPASSLLVRARVIVGTATFFDAVDSLALAYVLPVVVPLWGLQPTQVGALIATGFLGQLVGAMFFGWLAERRGRIRTLSQTVAVYSAGSFLCALAWGFPSLFAFRTFQGLGLGGEVPVAATYINEWARAPGRGRYVLLYELVFPLGLVAAALLGLWVVPTLGWRYMFLIGAIPALLTLVLRRTLPESPRWLVGRGRLKEADGILRRQEADGSGPGAVDGAARAAVRRAADLPAAGVVGGAATDWRELFHGRYRARTLAVWVLWFTAYLVGFGLTIWLPTVYSTVFGLELQRALLYGLATAVAGLAGAAACALLIDALGRRVWFAAAFVLGGLPLVLLWGTGARSAEAVLVGASVSYFFVSSICLALYLYTPEIYPTRLRALGCSVATAWLRLASAIGPFVVGVALSRGGLPPIFLLFGVVAVAGGLVAWRFTTETKGRVLEEISP